MKKSASTYFTALVVLAAMMLTACSDKKDNASTDSAATTSAPAGLQGAMSEEGQKAAALATLPQAASNIQLTQYTELNSGNQIMFLYYALSSLPVDYEQIASVYSRDYMNTSDAFKKADILKALKPVIDAEIAKAKSNRYFVDAIDANLDSYDFNAKGFPIQDDLSADSTRYYNDNSTYKYQFTNGINAKMLKPNDENLARQIETMRNKYPTMRLRIYAFAQGVDMSNQTVKAQIVKLQLLDGHGSVLLTQ